MADDLAVVTCQFNPAGYRTPRENFNRFTAGLDRDGVRWYAIELAFHEAPFSLPAAGNVFHFRSRTVLWHKENLLNLLAARLPSEIRKIIWADADLIFSTPDWWRRASELLEEKTVIQPFETAAWLNSDGSVDRRKQCFVRYLLNTRPKSGDDLDWRECHPGFAWGARREFFERGGLYAFNILGGGDLSMAVTFAGLKESREWNGHITRHVAAYAREMAWIDRNLGYLPGVEVRHLWHGELKDRQRKERRLLLKEFDFDPLTDVSRDANGIFQWASDKPKFHAAVSRYFNQRKEDLPAWRRLWQFVRGRGRADLVQPA